MSTTRPQLPADWYKDPNGLIRYRSTDEIVLCTRVVGRRGFGPIRCFLPYGHQGPCRP